MLILGSTKTRYMRRKQQQQPLTWVLVSSCDTIFCRTARVVLGLSRLTNVKAFALAHETSRDLPADISLSSARERALARALARASFDTGCISVRAVHAG